MDSSAPKKFAAAALAVALAAQSTGAANLAVLAPNPAMRMPPPAALRVALQKAAAPRAVLPVPIPREPLLLAFSRTALGEIPLDIDEFVRLGDDSERLKGAFGADETEEVARENRARELRSGLTAPLAVLAFFLLAARVVRGAFRNAPVKPRVDGRWIEAPGLRYRVNFVDALADSWIDADGYHVYAPYLGRENLRRYVDARYFGHYAAYMSGQAASYEVEIENLGTEPLSGLSVWVNQETFNASGSRGDAVQPPKPVEGGWAYCPCVLLHKAMTEASFKVAGGRYGPSLLPSLPGRTRVVFHRVLSVGEGPAAVNYAQLHLLIASSSGGREKILADDPQAGLVDPPGP